MTLKNIKTDMWVKNYKEMCKLLEEPERGGNSKNAQLKEWARYFDYERDGYAFIIGEIHDVPRKKEDMRYKYRNYIGPILLKYLSGCSEKRASMTRKNWYKSLGLVPEDFFSEERRQEHWENYHPDTYTQNYTYHTVSRCLGNIFQTALTGLQRGHRISYERIWLIAPLEGVVRKATDDEVAIIKTVNNTVMTEVGAKNEYSLSISYKKTKAFNKRTNEIFSKQYHWKRAWEVFSIQADEEWAECYANFPIEEDKRELNRLICAEVMRTIYKEEEKDTHALFDEWDKHGNEENYEWKFHYAMGMSIDAGLIVNEMVRLSDADKC